MPDLVSMKLAPRKPRTLAEGPETADHRPAYPWGLELSLDDETLTKLKMSDLPEVGAVVTVVARATVTRISSQEDMKASDGDGKKKHRNVSLQITDMALTDDEAQATAQDVLYKG